MRASTSTTAEITATMSGEAFTGGVPVGTVGSGWDSGWGAFLLNFSANLGKRGNVQIIKLVKIRPEKTTAIPNPVTINASFKSTGILQYLIYNGIFPCFLTGFVSSLPANIANALIKRILVLAGTITSSM